MSFKDNDSRKSVKQFLDGRNFFYQPIKNILKTFGNIREFFTAQVGGYTTACLLDHPYFKSYYKSIAIDLRKKWILDADSKSTEQINFTRTLDRAEDAAMLLKKQKKQF